MNQNLKDIELIIFDLDGVIYKDNIALLGAKETIDYLEENNINYCFFTNNSSYNQNRYERKLHKFGIYVDQSKIITASKLLHKYLKTNEYNNIYVLGSKALKQHLYNDFQKDDIHPECIVIGMDENIKLKDISKLINLTNNQTKLIAANPDKLIPKQDGFDLECGVIISLIEEFTKKEVNVLGKPNNYGYEHILETFNIDVSKCLMVGDTYETDILGAQQLGMRAVWVETGNVLPNYLLTKTFMSVKNLIDLKEELEKEKRS